MLYGIYTTDICNRLASLLVMPSLPNTHPVKNTADPQQTKEIKYELKIENKHYQKDGIVNPTVWICTRKKNFMYTGREMTRAARNAMPK